MGNCPLRPERSASAISPLRPGGAEGIRTPYLNTASVALYQLSYSPEGRRRAHGRDRTDDLILTKNVLYRLSYVGVVPEASR